MVFTPAQEAVLLPFLMSFKQYLKESTELMDYQPNGLNDLIQSSPTEQFPVQKGLVWYAVFQGPRVGVFKGR